MGDRAGARSLTMAAAPGPAWEVKTSPPELPEAGAAVDVLSEFFCARGGVYRDGSMSRLKIRGPLYMF